MTQYGVEPDDLASFIDGRLSKEDRAKFMKKLAESPEAYELFIETVEDLYPESQREHTAEWERDERIISEALFEPVSIDGKLTGEARARMVERLAGSEAAHEVFVETVRLQGERLLESPEVIPIRGRRHAFVGAWKIWVPAAAAASLLPFLGRPLIDSLRGPSALDFSTARIVAQLTAREDLASSLGEGWDEPGWSVTRGAAARFVESERAFRLGVRNVDLRVALRLQDVPLADGFLSDIQEWLGEIDLSQAVRAQYATVQTLLSDSGASGALGQLGAAEVALDEFLSSPSLPIGMWSEAARLAAVVREPAFFESDETSRLLDTIDGQQLPEPDVDALRQIRALIADGLAEADYPELNSLVRELIRRNGG